MEEMAQDPVPTKEPEVAPLKFAFSASKPKFSASRPPLFPRGKQRSGDMDENRDMEYVTGFDEQGIVAKDSKGRVGARVIPKLENSWRPEKRMKNIMMDTDIMVNTDERFEKEVETVIGGPNAVAQYGLTMGVRKVQSEEAKEAKSVTETEQNGKTVAEVGAEKSVERNELTFSQMEEQRLRSDLISLPDEADLDAYEDMPVEDFGEAILRGMGWEKGKPIGRNSKVAVIPVEYVKRSGRTGLGADAAPKELSNQRHIKPGDSRLAAPELVAPTGPDGRVRHVVTVDEKLVEKIRKGVARGKLMSIISGRHLGMRGTVLEVLESENSDRVSVKLVKSGEKVLVSAKDLADIGSLEEEKVLKQIRQLRIGNGDNTNESNENVDEEDGRAGKREDRQYERKDSRKETRKETDTRRDERGGGREDGSKVDNIREEEELGTPRRDSRRDERGEYEEQKRSVRDGRRERKRDEYERANDNMDVEDEGRMRRADERRNSVRHQKREDRREDGRRESRREERREDDRSHGRNSRDKDAADERLGKDRKSQWSDPRSSEDRNEKDRGASGGGSYGQDSSVLARREPWLTSQIRVRIISKSLKGGRLYLKKARIVDVVSPKECDLLVDESGEMLQRVQQDYLETALPRRGGRVKVVGGKFQGLLGKLIERNSEEEVGLVQMEESFEMVTLSLDLLAEFVGDISEMDA